MNADWLRLEPLGMWLARRDLARVERNLRHADWVAPLTQPFERPEPRTGRVELRC